jgi:hypothetical protein
VWVWSAQLTCCVRLLLPQERLTCQEAMAHPYFAPVRQREGFDAQGNRVAAPVAAGAGSGAGGT